MTADHKPGRMIPFKSFTTNGEKNLALVSGTIIGISISLSSIPQLAGMVGSVGLALGVVGACEVYYRSRSKELERHIH